MADLPEWACLYDYGNEVVIALSTPDDCEYPIFTLGRVKSPGHYTLMLRVTSDRDGVRLSLEGPRTVHGDLRVSWEDMPEFARMIDGKIKPFPA